jgi:hypothetical protein
MIFFFIQNTEKDRKKLYFIRNKVLQMQKYQSQTLYLSYDPEHVNMPIGQSQNT